MSDSSDKTGQSPSADITVRSPGPSADTNSLAERLLRLTTDAGGIAALARLIGVSSKTLSRYLKGSPAKHSTLVQLAAATGVRLEWLASGEGPMRPGDPPPAASPPQTATPQETRASAPAPLFASVNMDRLAEAYTAALQALARSGQYQPDARSIMQVTVLLYDEVVAVKPSK